MSETDLTRVPSIPLEVKIDVGQDTTNSEPDQKELKRQPSQTQTEPTPQTESKPQTEAPAEPEGPLRQPGERKDFHQKIFKTPKETGMGFVVAAQSKAAYSWPKLFLVSFMAGVLLSFSGILSIFVGKGMGEWPEGIQRFMMGFTFSWGLVYIIVMGADLFTGNTMIMTVGLLNRSITWKDYARSLTVSFIMNFVGSIFVAAFFGYFSELFDQEPYLTAVRTIAVKKILLPPHVAFLRGISANWLVNVAVFMAASAESVEGKILAIILPIANFVASGMEHSVANMFFVPLGLMYGAESDFGTFIYRNLILVVLGNWIGGAIGVGVFSWFSFVRDAPPPPPKAHKKKKTA